MADFRRILYALALVALLAGSIATADAQDVKLIATFDRPVLSISVDNQDRIYVFLASNDAEQGFDIVIIDKIQPTEASPLYVKQSLQYRKLVAFDIARRDTPLHEVLSDLTPSSAFGGPRLPLPDPQPTRPLRAVDQFIRYTRS